MPFIVLDGPEGAGKSVQLRKLSADLKIVGLDPITTKEPGGTLLGRHVRNILLDAQNCGLDPFAEFLLFQADRAQHISELVRPALKSGRFVLSDRYIFSSIAYQIVGRGLDEKVCRQVIEMATQGLMPDLTIILMVSPEIGLKRAISRSTDLDRIEREEGSFHQRVAEAYESFIHTFPNCVRVDAEQEESEVYRDILQKLAERFPASNVPSVAVVG